MSNPRACKRKEAFHSKARAREVIRARLARGSLPMKSYRCEVCGFWHLTTWKQSYMPPDKLDELYERKRKWRERRANK